MEPHQAMLLERKVVNTFFFLKRWYGWIQSLKVYDGRTWEENKQRLLKYIFFIINAKTKTYKIKTKTRHK